MRSHLADQVEPASEPEAASKASASEPEDENDGLLELDDEAEGEVAPLLSTDEGDASDN